MAKKSPQGSDLELAAAVTEEMRAERLAERMSTLPEFQGLAINKTRLLIQGALLHLDYLEDKYGTVKKKGR